MLRGREASAAGKWDSIRGTVLLPAPGLQDLSSQAAELPQAATKHARKDLKLLLLLQTDLLNIPFHPLAAALRGLLSLSLSLPEVTTDCQ